MRAKEDTVPRTIKQPPTAPLLGVQVVYYSQFELAARYARRHDATMVVPRMLMDREADRLEAHALLAPEPEPVLDPA
jgi:hypothetical protein